MSTQQSMKQIAKQVSELLTKSLQAAMNQTMTHNDGQDWFSRLMKEERCSDHPILQNQTSIYDCDLVSLLKLLRYRTKRSEKLLSLYNFDISETQMDNFVRRKQLFLLLDRLIARTPGQPLYGDEESVRDMKKLSSVFSAVKDENGNPYDEQIGLIVRRHALAAAKTAYPIDQTMKQERMSGSVRSVVSACRQLRIDTAQENGTQCFLSNDYMGDIDAIKSLRRQRRKNRLTAGVIGLICAALLLGAGLAGKHRYDTRLAEQKKQAAAAALAKYNQTKNPDYVEDRVKTADALEVRRDALVLRLNNGTDEAVTFDLAASQDFCARFSKDEIEQVRQATVGANDAELEKFLEGELDELNETLTSQYASVTVEVPPHSAMTVELPAIKTTPYACDYGQWKRTGTLELSW